MLSPSEKEYVGIRCKPCQGMSVWPPASGSISFWTSFIVWVFSPEAKEVRKDYQRLYGLWGIKFLMCVHKLSFDKYLISSTVVVSKFYYFILSEVLSYFSHCRCVEQHISWYISSPAIPQSSSYAIRWCLPSPSHLLESLNMWLMCHFNTNLHVIPTSFCVHFCFFIGL